jgi:hypothetical protein
MTWADISIIGTVAVVTIVDVILLVLHKKTISNRMRFWGQQVAAPFYLWGVLGGHFVGDIDPIVSLWAGIGIVVGGCLAISGAHFLACYFNLKPPWYFGLFYLSAGVVLGLLFWPQG